MKRRSILKSMTIGTMGVTAAGTATADNKPGRVKPEHEVPEHAEIRGQYAELTDIDNTDTSTNRLVSALHADGLVSDPELTKLSAISDGANTIEQSSHVDLMSTVDTKPETPTAVIRVSDKHSETQT
ncbi:MAG: hypothetical protein J07HX5_01980, partial [halophilic archaeon J07HX5]